MKRTLTFIGMLTQDCCEHVNKPALFHKLRITVEIHHKAIYHYCLLAILFYHATIFTLLYGACMQVVSTVIEFCITSLLLPAGCARSAHPASPKIAFMFSVCVRVRPQISRALSYVILLLCHYSHERSWKLLKVCRHNRPRYIKLS